MSTLLETFQKVLVSVNDTASHFDTNMLFCEWCFKGKELDSFNTMQCESSDQMVCISCVNENGQDMQELEQAYRDFYQ